MNDKHDLHEGFATRLGLLLSVLGIAVGTGNIWRFPRIAAQNGGDDGAGAFLVAWIVFLFLWSIPLIIAEYAIGRHGRRGTVGSIMGILGEKFAWMGGFVGFVAMAIMFYYSVVTGWCFYYFGITVGGGLPTDIESSSRLWDAFQAGYWPIVLHAVAMFGGAYTVWKGIRFIETISKILIPSLLLIVLIILVRAVTLEGSGAGIRYLFTPDWSTLSNPSVWLEALTQNAWDTGAGWGLILTCGVYEAIRVGHTQCVHHGYRQQHRLAHGCRHHFFDSFWHSRIHYVECGDSGCDEVLRTGIDGAYVHLDA